MDLVDLVVLVDLTDLTDTINSVVVWSISHERPEAASPISSQKVSASPQAASPVRCQLRLALSPHGGQPLASDVASHGRPHTGRN